ncbi:MAG: hypothetical protein AAB562_04385 [Patescibacteria group bacterium]
MTEEERNDHPATEQPTRNRAARTRRTSRSRKKEIDQGLREIYEHGGETPNFNELEQAEGGRVRKTLLGVTVFFALLAAVAWTGFFVFKPYLRSGGSAVKLEIEGPNEAKSGEEIAYAINYQNQERSPLAQATLTVLLPKEFTLAEANPTPTEPNTWIIGSLDPGEQGSVTLRGTVTGEVGGLSVLQTLLTYRPANFNSDFEHAASLGTKLTSSVLTLELMGPEEATNGEPAPFEIRYRNDGAAAAGPLEIHFSGASHYLVESTDPQTTDDATVWRVDSLPPNEERVIKVNGSFASDAEGTNETGASIGLLADGTFLTQARATSTTKLGKGALVLTTIVNGSAADFTANPGDNLLMSVTVENASDETLRDLTIILNIEPTPETGLLDWKTLEPRDGIGARERVRWTKREVPTLAKLNPGERTTVDASIPLNAAPAPSSTRNEQVEIWAEGAIKGRKQTLQSRRVVVRLLSDLKFQVGSRYYSDEDIAVGTGPHPPRVGQTSTYRVFWNLTNSLHALGPITVSTKLPPGVAWTGRSEANLGSLTFDSASRTVSWQIANLASPLPADAPLPAANFEVGITPTANQAGSVITLTEPTSVTAHDQNADALIFQSIAPLDTNLAGDPNLAGRGEVVP